METWRVVGSGVIGVGGVLLVLVAMAQARDTAVRTKYNVREPTGQRVLRTALLGLALLGVTVVLVLTVLPQLIVWTLAALMWLILGVIILAD